MAAPDPNENNYDRDRRRLGFFGDKRNDEFIDPYDDMPLQDRRMVLFGGLAPRSTHWLEDTVQMPEADLTEHEFPIGYGHGPEEAFSNNDPTQLVVDVDPDINRRGYNPGAQDLRIHPTNRQNDPNRRKTIYQIGRESLEALARSQERHRKRPTPGSHVERLIKAARKRAKQLGIAADSRAAYVDKLIDRHGERKDRKGDERERALQLSHGFLPRDTDLEDTHNYPNQNLDDEQEAAIGQQNERRKQLTLGRGFSRATLMAAEGVDQLLLTDQNPVMPLGEFNAFHQIPALPPPNWNNQALINNQQAFLQMPLLLPPNADQNPQNNHIAPAPIAPAPEIDSFGFDLNYSSDDSDQ